MPRNNAQHLEQLVNKGKLDQYIDKIDGKEMNDLMSALNGDSSDSVSDILKRNIATGGEGIGEIFNGLYDDQIEALGERIVENFFNNLEVENIKIFREADVDKIREQIKIVEDLPELSGFNARASKILEKLKSAETELVVPGKIGALATELLESKGKDVSDVRNSKVVQEWGKSRERALVLWGKKGILAVKYLDKKEKIPRQKRSRLEYTPVQKELRDKTPRQILSKKGEDFSLKERMFVTSRKKKSEDELLSDYQRVFGKIRPPKEIKDLISKRFDKDLIQKHKAK